MSKKFLVIVAIIIIVLVIGIVVVFNNKEEKNSVSNSTNSYYSNVTNVLNQPENDTPINTQKFNRTPENVTIEIDNSTIKPDSVSITITDNNENHYGWGVEFKIQEKNNGEWKDLDYISNDLTWIDIAYELNQDNQLTQKLDIEKYYGKLNSGIYRVVKPVYDDKYIDIYSNEFEIK